MILNADGVVLSGGSYIFSSSLNSDSTTRDLMIDPGAGNSVTFSGLVGNNAPLGAVSIGAGANVTIGSEMTLGSFVQTGGTGSTMIEAGMIASGGEITISSEAISISAIVITTTDAALTIDNSGLFTASGAVFTLDGPFQQTGGGDVSISGSIQTADQTVSFAAPVALSSNLEINTYNASGADISFSDTVDGAYNLALSAAGGSISFGGAVGGNTPVGAVSILSAADVSVADFSCASLAQTTASGTTALSGAVIASALGGVNLSGASFEINGSIATSAGGPVSIANSGPLSFGPSADLSISGAFTQTQSGPVSLGGEIAAGGNISFASAATLAYATTLDTSSNSTNIVFSGERMANTVRNSQRGPVQQHGAGGGAAGGEARSGEAR